MAKATVRRIKSDYIKATQKGAEAVVVAIAKQGSANSIRIARRKDGFLRGSIKVKQIKKYVAIWFTDIAYNLAQEYGIPGTEYTFTPYMRPGARAMRSKLKSMSKAIMRKFYANMRTRRE